MTAEQITQLREDAQKCVTDMRSIQDGLTDPESKETRGMNADETTNYNNLETRYDELENQIADAERVLNLEQREARMQESQRNFSPDGNAEGTGNSGAGDQIVTRTNASIDAENRALDRLESRGFRRLNTGEQQLVQGVQQRAFEIFCRSGLVAVPANEMRGLMMGSDEDGGYLVAPQQWVGELIKDVDNQTFIRQLATTITLTGAHSLGQGTLDSDVDDAEWTPELKTGSEDKALKLGARKSVPHPLAKRIKISKTLLRHTPGRAEALVRERFAYKFGVTEEKAFIVGDGVQKPLGIMTASEDGIGTGRDVSDDNTAAQIKADNLINVLFFLKGQYHAKARWLFHRDAVKQIRKLKDNEGQYLWQPSIQVGNPGTILGLPYLMSEYMPNTFTTGKYVGALGDFSKYQIVDSMNFEIQRLNELYAETNEVGFIGRAETDGSPLIEEAFVRVKLG